MDCSIPEESPQLEGGKVVSGVRADEDGAVAGGEPDVVRVDHLKIEEREVQYAARTYEGA
jgi:hypothetical protein